MAGGKMYPSSTPMNKVILSKQAVIGTLRRVKRIKKKAPVSRGANSLIPVVNAKNELKQHDIAQADTRMNVTGSLTLLNAMAQGITDGTRIADIVKFKSLDIRLRTYCTLPTTSRLILFIDTAPHGSAPSIADILDANDPQTSNTGILSHRNKVNLKRFVFLFDKKWTYNPQINAVQHEFFQKFYKKLNLGTDYSRGNANTIADIQTNAIYFLALSNNINASSNPYYLFTANMKYTDD